MGQSMVEYAVGLGCVTALCMCALSFLGFVDWKILHAMQHAFFPGHHAGAPGHAQPIANTSAQPWQLQ